MVAAHRMVTRTRGEGWASTLAFIGGYLAVWTAAGTPVFAAVVALGGVPPGAAAAWVAPAAGGALIAAGLYQFTPLKSVCLRSCRSPVGFILTHDFRTGARGAFVTGVVHGGYCLGCCWALMAILLVVGLMNLLWMLAFTAIVFLEKHWRAGGIPLSRIVGIGLVIVGVAVMLRPELLAHLAGVSAPIRMPPGDPMRM
jgi:predicted metal-binding membrane protein